MKLSIWMPPKKSKPLLPVPVTKLMTDGYFIDARVSARNRLAPEEVDANDVTHMDSSRNQTIGSSAGLIPFVEKNYVLRSLMGSNQERQAVPLIKPESANCWYRF